MNQWETAERKVAEMPGPVPAVLCGDLNMLRCFAERNIPTVVVATDPAEVTLRSRHCHDYRVISPLTNVDRAVLDLESIGKELSRPVLFYGDDAMLLLVSRHRKRLGRYFRFRLPSADLVEDLVDKARFDVLARRHGLPVPATVRSDELSSAEQAIERIRLPCVIKPSNHTGWHAERAKRGVPPLKALTANTPDEFRAAFREASQTTDHFVIQQYIAGKDNAIFSYHAYFGKNGLPLAQYAGRKIRTYPSSAGVSTYLELVKEPKILDLGRAICKTLGLVGPVKIDFKREPHSGRYYLLELNPRFTLWNYLGTACGINLPKIAYADLVGERCIVPTDYHTKVRWLSFGNDLRSFLRDYRKTGELSWTEYLSSYRSRLIFDVFSWRDPVPFGFALAQYGLALKERLFDSNRVSGP